MSAGNTVRFAAEFDDTDLIRGLNSSKTAFNQAFANQPGIQGLEQEIAGLQAELGQLEQSTNTLEQGFSGLNSASTGIGGTFQEIGDAANQAGDNFNTLGTAGATVEQQLAEIGTTSTTMGQSMQALGTDIDTTGTSMGALASNFTETTGTSDTLMQSLAGSTTQFKGLGEEAEGTGSTLKDMFSKGGSIAVGISATISGIANLVRGFRDYDDAMLRVRKGQRSLSLAQEAAGKAQDKYNAAVAQFGKDSTQAAKAQLDLKQATDKVANVQDQLAISTKRAGDAQLNIWLGLAGTVTGIGGSIMQVLTGIGGEKGLAGLSAKLAPLKAAFTTFGSGVITALSGIGGAFTVVGAGIVLAMHLLDQDTKTVQAFSAAGVQLTSVQQDSNKAFAEMEAIMRVTHMSMLQVIEDPKKAVETYKALGGEVSSTGEIVTKSVDQWDSARSGIQILFDTIAKGVGELLNLDKGIKKVDASVATHIPTVIHLSSSWRTVIKDHSPVTEQYVMGARELDMYNVVMQTSAETTKKVAEGFATLPGAVDKGTKAITGHTTATTALTAKFGPLLIDLPDLEADTIALAEAMGEGAQADIDRKNTLAGVTTAAKLAATQFTEFTDQAKLAGETNEILRDKLEAYVTTELHVQNAQGMTLQQLKDLVEAHFDSGKATEMATKAAEDNKKALEEQAKAATEAAKAQREVRDAMAQSVSAFSDITGALTKEDFTKAFKEFKATMQNLIPSETIKNVKSFFQDLQTEGLRLGKVSKLIDLVFAAVVTGSDKIKSTDIKNIIGGITTELQSLASINPRAAQISKMIFEPLQKLEGPALTKKIADIGDAIFKAKTAMADGWVTADEYNDVMAALNTTTADTAKPLDAAGKATGALTTGLDKSGTAAGVAAPKLDAVAEALNSVILAGEDVGKRIAALKFNFPAPNLAAFAKNINSALSAAQIIVNKITALKPVLTIKGDNKQALAAINAVVNAQGKIKNIVQVIKGNNSDALNKINQVVNAQGKIRNILQTITTRYVTQGSPVRSAHNIVGAHTSTRIGGGEETAAVGGGGNMTNTIVGGGGQGDVNVIINMRDEFGIEKQRRFKAVLGRDRYVFGAVGSGG